MAEESRKSFIEDPAAAAVEEDDELEASLYLYTYGGGEGLKWFVIRNDSKASEEGTYLRPELVKNNPNRNSSATVSVGSNIYVIGGGDLNDPNSFKTGTCVVAFDSVDYIDTNCPEAGWIKAAPMNHRRMECFAVPVVKKQQICVFQGRWRVEGIMDAEVYDIRNGTWSDLNVWPYPDVLRPNSFAVAKNGTDILLYSDVEEPLIWYDAEDDYYDILRERICGGARVRSFAMSDNILYIAGYDLPGRLMALDVYDPDAEPQIISGLVGREELPSPVGTRLHVVELAKNKLALIWSDSDGRNLFVFCLKIVISKKESPGGGGGFIFEAKSVSPISMYIMETFILLNILPMKTDWKEVHRRNREYRRLQKKEKKKLGKTRKENENEDNGEEKAEKDKEVEVDGKEKSGKEEEGKEKTKNKKKKKKKKKKNGKSTTTQQEGQHRQQQHQE